MFGQIIFTAFVLIGVTLPLPAGLRWEFVLVGGCGVAVMIVLFVFSLPLARNVWKTL